MKGLTLINSKENKVYWINGVCKVSTKYYQFDNDSVIKTIIRDGSGAYDGGIEVNEISYIKKFEQVHSSFRIQTSYSLFKKGEQKYFKLEGVLWDVLPLSLQSLLLEFKDYSLLIAFENETFEFFISNGKLDEYYQEKVIELINILKEFSF